MADLRDFTGKNRKFTGTIGERLSTGSTAERDTTFGAGTIRFNTTTNLMEYYTGVLWKSIDAPPTVTAITPTNVLTSQFPDSSTSVTFAITGSLFSAGAVVEFLGTDGSIVTANTVTVNSTTSITATVNQKVLFSSSLDPYDVRVTNVSGLFAILDNQINVNQAVTFTNAAGSLGSFSNEGASVSVNAGGTDPEGGAITYSVSAGSLPSWASLNASTGVISGTTSGSGTETSTFTIAARDAASNVSRREFSITTRNPVITTFNSPGTFSVPSTTTSVDVLVVGGGGGSGSQHAGGAGAGGLIFRPGFPVSAGSSIPVTVGGGGGQVTDGTQPPAGADSVFSTLTAKAGGGGGRGWTSANAGHPGGSGGGGSGPGHPGAGATQPSQPGDSGTYGFGNPGGNSTGPGSGGGGGAGGNGSNPPDGGNGGPGGAGRTYTISGSPVTYAGGGGGGGHTSPPGGSGGPGGGGNGGAHPGNPGQSGTANRGGGAGAGAFGGGQGAQGGSGVVIVKS